MFEHATLEYQRFVKQNIIRTILKEYSYFQSTNANAADTMVSDEWTIMIFRKFHDLFEYYFQIIMCNQAIEKFCLLHSQPCSGRPIRIASNEFKNNFKNNTMKMVQRAYRSTQTANVKPDSFLRKYIGYSENIQPFYQYLKQTNRAIPTGPRPSRDDFYSDSPNVFDIMQSRAEYLETFALWHIQQSIQP